MNVQKNLRSHFYRSFFKLYSQELHFQSQSLGMKSYSRRLLEAKVVNYLNRKEANYQY
jgi:hypothetical protein